MSKLNAPKKKMASSTSRIKWKKEVNHKLDGGRIESYDIDIGRYNLHVWQMYNQENPWNWILKDENARYDARTLVHSSGEEDLIDAKDRVMKAFIWFFAMKLVRNSDDARVILKGFE